MWEKVAEAVVVWLKVKGCPRVNGTVTVCPGLCGATLQSTGGGKLGYWVQVWLYEPTLTVVVAPAAKPVNE
jgi:hypothetical protein